MKALLRSWETLDLICDLAEPNLTHKKIAEIAKNHGITQTMAYQCWHRVKSGVDYE